MERRLEVETLLSLAAHTVEVDDSVTQRGVTCFLQNRVHLKAATLRKIYHIGHRRQMANIRDKPLVWLKGEVKPLRSLTKRAWKPGCFSGGSRKGKG
jgi:hypothetical protein